MDDFPPFFSDLFLLRFPDTGPARYWQLVKAFGDADQVLQQAPSLLKDYLCDEAVGEIACLQRSGDSPIAQKCFRDLDWVAEQGAALVQAGSEYYPRLLAETVQMPPLLYVWGDIELLDLPQLAMVGSRKPSSAGRSNARSFAGELASGGFVITSGLALGIDAECHKGALTTDGKTIAVLGTGLDVSYPRRNGELREQILAQGGALITEYPLGTGPLAGNFPRRNRIVSGMSLGVVVVEAALKSGSLITARLAMEQNREVFAIPGSIHNPLSRGCHHLIRHGATLAETSQDIVEQLDGGLGFHHQTLGPELFEGGESRDIGSLSVEQQHLLQSLDYDSLSLDELLARVGLPVDQVLALLSQLEVGGHVSQENGMYTRC